MERTRRLIGATAASRRGCWPAQPLAIYDSSGALVLRWRGALHHHTIFDTGGDHVPGGQELEYLGADVHGPHDGFETKTFCQLIAPVIGS
jgi:hypothetical protein